MFNQTAELQKRAAVLRPIDATGVPRPSPPGEEVARAEVHITQAEMDATLEDSFPASDPPSWTAAIARPVSRRAREGQPERRLLRRAAARV